MRPPTLNEVRKTDRIIFEEILKWVSKGHGRLDDGLSHYLSNPEDPLWKLCAQQVESLPDQGKEKSLDHKRKAEVADEEPSDSKRRKADSRAKKEKKGDPEPRLCIVCKTKHEPRARFPQGGGRSKGRNRRRLRNRKVAARARKNRDSSSQG